MAGVEYELEMMVTAATRIGMKRNKITHKLLISFLETHKTNDKIVEFKSNKNKKDTHCVQCKKLIVSFHFNNSIKDTMDKKRRIKGYSGV